MTVFSKRSMEGYVLMDNRWSPGLSADDIATAGPCRVPIVPIQAGQKFEAPTFTCHVCEKIVIMNPKRTRARAYCPRHDAFTCDECELVRVQTGTCKSSNERIDEFLTKAALALPI